MLVDVDRAGHLHDDGEPLLVSVSPAAALLYRRQRGLGVFSERFQRLAKPGLLVRRQPGKPETTADAVDTLRDARAILIAGNPRTAADRRKQLPYPIVERVTVSGRQAMTIEVMEVRRGTGGATLRCRKAVAERSECCLQPVTPHECSIQTKLPGDVTEQRELRSRKPGFADPLRREAFAVREGVRVVKPAIDVQVVLDAGQHGLELRSFGSLTPRKARRPDPPVGHPPQVGQHRADARQRVPQIAHREAAVQQEVHAL